MVLVIVDCQPRYLPFGPVLEAVEREVKHARDNNVPIIFLEYHYASPTYEHITDLVAGYDKFEVVEKRQFGGGKEVVATCKRRGWKLDAMRVGGAETYCCVAETSEQVVEESPDTVQEIVKDACFDKVCGGPFPRHDNIRWV